MKFNKIYLLISLFLVNIPILIYAQNELILAKSIQENRIFILSYNGNINIQNLREFTKSPVSDKINVDLIKNQYIMLQNEKIQKDGSGNTKFTDLIETPNSNLQTGISESELIIAITDVLIERGKEELATAFFSKMAERFEAKDSLIINELYLNDVVHKDYKISPIYLKNLFPNLYFILKNSTQFINIQLNNTFKTALEKDLQGLLLNIDKYIIPEDYKSCIQYTLSKTIYKTIVELENKSHPAIIFKNIRPKISIHSNKFDHVLNLLCGISESLLDNSEITGNNNDDVWLNLNSINYSNYLNQEGLNYYISLIYNNNKNKPSFDSLLNWTNFDMVQAQSLAPKIFDIITKISGLEIKIKDFNSYENSSKTKDVSELIYNLTNNVISMIKNVTDLNKNISKSGLEIEKGLNNAAFVNEFVFDIHKKNFSSAILTAIKIVDENIHTYKNGTFKKDLLKYLTFAADISQAKTSEDASNIFEAAILPTGSYRLKRCFNYSSSISAYVGINGGAEWLDDGDKKPAGYTGMFLPIGIDFSWSDGTEDIPSPSNSLFFSVLDLGVVAGYRFKNTNTDNNIDDNVPLIKFEHIIAPGIFYMHGFADFPLDFGLGIEYLPKLRAITDDQNLELNKANGFRATAFIAVDLPLFNIYGK